MPRFTCSVTKKERFSDRLDAELALADIHRMNTHHRRRKYRDEPIRSYFCNCCRGWHLTSMTKDGYESRRTVSN